MEYRQLCRMVLYWIDKCIPTINAKDTTFADRVINMAFANAEVEEAIAA